MSDIIIADTDLSEIGIYNGVCTEYAGGLSPSATDNSAALTAVINAAIAGTGPEGVTNPPGGVVLIPPGKYTFQTPMAFDNPGGDNVGLEIVGCGGCTELVADLPGDVGTLFTFTGFGGAAGNGIRFKNLKISYATTSSPGPAISISSSQNITCDEVYFYNCPQAFVTDNQSLQCGLDNCTIDYEIDLDNQTMVALAGSEDFVRDSVIRQKSSATGCYGIAISSNNGIYLDDTHISDFDYGILVTDSARDSFISSILIDANVCGIQIKPSNATQKINNIVISHCVFAQTLGGGAGGSGNSGAVITIPDGGAGSNVAGITFYGCIAYGWGAAGIEIDGGQNIVVTSGQYSSNGQASGTPASLAAGIAIAGGTIITVVGADCTGVNEYWQHNAASPVTQPCAVAVSNGSGSVSEIVIDSCSLQDDATYGVTIAQSGPDTVDVVLVRDCNLDGYSNFTEAVSVSGTVSNIEVTNCYGYNDLAKTIHGVSSPPAGIFYNTTYGYYGPVVFYVFGTGILSVEVNTLTVPVAFGAFNLPCNVGAKVNATGGTPQFAVVGM